MLITGVRRGPALGGIVIDRLRLSDCSLPWRCDEIFLLDLSEAFDSWRFLRLELRCFRHAAAELHPLRGRLIIGDALIWPFFLL